MGHGSMGGMGHGRGRAERGREHYGLQEKKRTASQSKRRREQAATRRAEGKDVSSARAWPNLRNFGHRRSDRQVSGQEDGVSGSHALAKISLEVGLRLARSNAAERDALLLGNVGKHRGRLGIQIVVPHVGYGY